MAANAKVTQLARDMQNKYTSPMEKQPQQPLSGGGRLTGPSNNLPDMQSKYNSPTIAMTQPQQWAPPYEDPVQRFRSANTVNMSAELFEKLFLTYQPSSLSVGAGSGASAPTADWRKSLGNPTPIALVGIVISLTPLSCDLMGWLGAGGNGAAGVASYYFFGGLLLLLAALLEFILGNTFPSVVFSSYGAFFLSFAGTLSPSFAAAAAYAPAGEDPSAGLATQGFNASFGWFLVWMAVLSAVFLLCALKTNVVFVIIFASLVGVFSSLSGAYFLLAVDFTRNAETAGSFVRVGGIFGFVASLAGWWIFLSIMMTVMDFPVGLPVGDLSGWIRSASQKDSFMDV